MVLTPAVRARLVREDRAAFRPYASILAEVARFDRGEWSDRRAETAAEVARIARAAARLRALDAEGVTWQK